MLYKSLFGIGLVASTALYGVLAFLLCVFGFHVGPSAIFDAAEQHVGVSGWFQAYMVVSLVGYPALMVLHVLIVRARINGEGWSPYEGPLLLEVPSWIVADFTNPFRGLRALVGMRGTIDASGPARGALLWGIQGFHLIWSLTLWTWLALGLAVVR